MREREPIFNVPGAVVAVLAVLLAVHVARQVLAPETDAWLVFAMAFVPARYAGEAGAGLPGGTWASVTSFVTHMLLHGSAAHLILNSAWLLAFGGAVTLRIGGVRFLLLTLLCGVAGAAVFLLFNPGLLAPMIGASGAVAGLMGGTMRFLFSALDDGGIRRLREAPRTVRLMPLAETLKDRRVQIATGLWLFLNLLAIFGFGGAQSGSSIAWEAHVGGFLAGLLCFGLFDLVPPERNCEKPTLH